MTGRVLEVADILQPDQLAIRITEKWMEWDMLRQIVKNDWEEIRRYVYATDTTQTSNSTLPWKNKTTVPKLCQINDNLLANYIATMFPTRKWLEWEANNKDSDQVRKKDSIVNYMRWSISHPTFKHEIEKVVHDYIHYGNCFVAPIWIDQRVEQNLTTQAGYIGPGVRRISPLDLVLNPTAENFQVTPKIVKSLIGLGELKDLLEKMSIDENKAEYEELWKYLKEVRSTVRDFKGDVSIQDRLYQVDGFTSYAAYLMSDTVEVLTFYGDLYDPDTDTFLKNHVITVVDRHKLIGKKPNPSFYGYPPIFHACWRKRQDNLWGMGPLANLVGMQYRMDHIENMGADMWDLTTFPVTKVKGFVEDFTWQPGEKIFVSEEGDVDLVQPDVNIMQSDMKIQRLEQLMEEMAGAPKEAMGFRTPGEKTKYEVQRLENAASRIFQNKIRQFEEQILEPLLNAMLEMARRNLTGTTVIKVFDNDFNVASFQELTVEDITGIGRIKPVAARHFAEQAELIQNLTNLTGSGLWPTVQPHFSGIKLARILEEAFNLQDYEVVTENIAISEQANAQKFANALQEQVMQSQGTATGMGGDYDISAVDQNQMQEALGPQ